LDQNVIKKARLDKRWRDVMFKHYKIPFVVTTGNKLGGILPRCRGCGVELARAQLRIEAMVKYKPVNIGPYPGVASLCLNTQCPQAAIKKMTSRVWYM
jgi:hypothetical protein